MEKALVGGLEKGYDGMLLVNIQNYLDAGWVPHICGGNFWRAYVYGCDGVLFAHSSTTLGLVSE